MYKHFMYDVTMTSLFLILLKLPIYSEIKAKLEFFPQKAQILEFHRFFAYKRKKWRL